MATKTKSNGDGSVKILGQDTPTAAQKSKSKIIKPEKVLREGLRERQKDYENMGWRFTPSIESEPPSWKAENDSPAFPILESESLVGVFKSIEEWKAEMSNAFEEFTENIDKVEADESWTWKLPRIQQFVISEFINAHEASVFYKTEDNRHVEVEYIDKQKNVATSTYFDYLGQRYNKRRPEWGANISGSILTLDQYWQENLDFAPGTSNGDQEAETAGEIDLLDIIPSPFDGQKRRRDRFTHEEISELADSIKSHGVLQPIVVRDVGSRYEIIAGERRWLAAKLAEIVTIPAVVKNVSDEVAFEIQTIENLQRKDPDPIDEAFSYQEYIEKYGRTVEDLAVKFGKPLKFIAGRLRLTRLIPEALADVAGGHLPLGHAFEIAKLAPETQKEALALCYDTKWENGEHVPDKTEPETLAHLRSAIDNEIFLSLKSAKFPLEDTNLRDDHLPCTKCPERTGAKGNLFENLHDPKNDRCLNSFCFSQKTSLFVSNVRATRSAEIVADGRAAHGYQMPIICWYRSNRAEFKKYFGETPLIDGEYTSISNQSGECDFMEFGIFVDNASRFGEVIKFCRSTDCPKHKNRISSSAGSSSTSVPGEKSDAEKEAFYKRKQEIFDIKVGEPVRLKVLAEAAKTFTGEKWVFDDEKWRVKLVERLWDKIDSNARTVIKEILGIDGYKLNPEKLAADQLSKILFLSIIANEGEMLCGSWRDQKEVIAAAAEFGVDYALLDAQERVAAAPKKFVDAAKEHLGKIERGEKVTRPVFYKLEK